MYTEVPLKYIETSIDNARKKLFIGGVVVKDYAKKEIRKYKEEILKISPKEYIPHCYTELHCIAELKELPQGADWITTNWNLKKKKIDPRWLGKRICYVYNSPMSN